MTSADAIHDLQKIADPAKALVYRRFFKTGKGQYGEGDVFLGVTVPTIRLIVKKYRDLSFPDLKLLLKSKWHEARLLGLLILVDQYESADEKMKNKACYFYLKNLHRVNNWDLVDSSAYKILGEFLFTRSRTILYDMALSNNLWVQRVAIVSTLAFIRRCDYSDTFRLAKMLLGHPHDLIHKATGWMLREVGKKDEKKLKSFLIKHAKHMPRTMLRYAIERLLPEERKNFLSQ